MSLSPASSTTPPNLPPKQRPSGQGSRQAIAVAQRMAAYQGGGLFVALVVLVFVFTISTSGFLTSGNLLTILLQVSVVGIVAVPGAMLVLQGYVDLSVGAVAVLVAVVFGQLDRIDGLGLVAAIVLSLVVGALYGALNGVLVSRLKFSPIIVTLGGYSGARGLAEALAHDQTVSAFGTKFAVLGNNTIVGVPIPAVIFVVVFLIGGYVWYETASGRHMTAIGADSAAARAAGLPVWRLPFVCYVLSGLAAGVGGLILTSELDGASVSIGVGLELQVLTAVLLGGVAFSGGRGSLWGVLFGVLFVGVLDDGLILLNVGPYYSDLAVGAVLIAAAASDAMYVRTGGAAGHRRAGRAGRRAAGPKGRPVATGTRWQVSADVQGPHHGDGVLELHGVTKRFGPVTAVRDVSLRVNRGEVCGLIGDNGAGKSTLVNLMSGTLSPDVGRLVLDGHEQVFSSPQDARAAGIETVFQHLALVPTLSIADNVFLGREIRRGGVFQTLRLMDKPAMMRETRDGFERLGVTLPPLRSKVAALSGASARRWRSVARCCSAATW